MTKNKEKTKYEIKNLMPKNLKLWQLDEKS